MANPVVIPQASWLDILNELVAVGNNWDGAVVRLFKNNYSPGPTTALGALTEADFTNYAVSAAIVWGAAGYDAAGNAVMTGDAKRFSTGASPTVFNTIYGYYVTDAGGSPTKLFFARRFDTPIPLSMDHQIIETIPSYPVYISQ